MYLHFPPVYLLQMLQQLRYILNCSCFSFGAWFSFFGASKKRSADSYKVRLNFTKKEVIYFSLEALHLWLRLFLHCFSTSLSNKSVSWLV